MAPKNKNRRLMRRQVDARLTKGREAAPYPSRPQTGWIRTIRDALGMTATQLARRMGIAQSSVAMMERREVNDAITLATLRRSAEAMKCDLVYLFLPRESLESTVQEQAYSAADAMMRGAAHSMTLESQTVEEGEHKAQVRDLAETMIQETDRRMWDKPWNFTIHPAPRPDMRVL